MNYPTNQWQRVWYQHSTMSCLGNGPNEANAQFDNDWSTGALAFGQADDVEVHSSRTINLPTSGTYTFTVGSDDGIRLYIDDVMQTDRMVDRAYATDTVSVYLAAGNHKFQINYYENGGDARLTFSYTSPNAPAAATCDAACKAQSFGGGACKSESSVSNGQLHVDGINIVDDLGREIRLIGTINGINERLYKANWQGAANPEESYFNEGDFERLKSYGANVIEIQGFGIGNFMPTKNVINEAYFANWVDKYAAWAQKHKVYIIINMNWLATWNIPMEEWNKVLYPDWIWQGMYSAPVTWEDYNNIGRDFLDLTVTKQDSNRQAFINIWKFIANRYKDNPYVIYSPINEPTLAVGGGYTVDDHNIVVGQSYSTFMERVYDAIRSTGAQQLVFIDRPYFYSYNPGPQQMTFENNHYFNSNFNLCIYPIDRDIVWEDHSYVMADWQPTIVGWKSTIDDMVQLYNDGYNKPFFVGEYSIETLDQIRTYFASNWKSILAQQVSYIDNTNAVGRQWLNHGALYGESPGEWERDSTKLTQDESNWIIQNVLNGSSFSPISSGTCQSGETQVQSNCSSGTCCCSGTIDNLAPIDDGNWYTDAQWIKAPAYNIVYDTTNTYQGNPSWKITLSTGSNTAVDRWGPSIKPGDHVVFSCWIKTSAATLQADVGNPQAGGRIGFDIYGEGGDVGGPDWGADAYVPFGTSDWKQVTIDWIVPPTWTAQSGYTNSYQVGQQVTPTLMAPWLQVWSDTQGTNEHGTAWFSNCELYVNP
jgi:hypothetical protein